MHTRCGFVFLYVLGLVGITLALAFALLANAQSANGSATQIQKGMLANQAAKEGVAHATAVIRRSFASGPAVPTQLSDAWRQEFWPIDTAKVGIATATTNDDASVGSEFTAEDLFENDVHVENTLTEAYRETDGSRGNYLRRGSDYNDGWFCTPGIARWIEPGARSDDPIQRPLSFHLSHPQLPGVGNVGDPAVVAGENYLPDLDEPVWYDSELVATTNPAHRRYRLRYAISIEDLTGHLLVSTPGDFDITATSVLSGSPTDVDRYKINEVDNAVADRYAGALSNMYRYTGYRAWEWGDIGLRGLGASDQYIGYQLGFNEGTVLASRDASGFMTYYDDADGGSMGPYHLPVAGNDFRMNHESVVGNSNVTHYFGVGPIPSFQAIWQRAGNVLFNHRPYLFSPFGKSPQQVANPSAWSEARVDCPWQINLPTMAPRVLHAMVYAYLPAEFKTQGSDRKETTFWDVANKYFPSHPMVVDQAPDGMVPVPATYSFTNYAVELFTDMASLAHFDQNGGIEPLVAYPGTKPSSPGAHWQSDLGEFIHTNTALGIAGMPVLNGSLPYANLKFSDETLHSERAAGGTNIKLVGGLLRQDSHGNWAIRPYGDGFNADAGFYYDRSYWLDLGVAMFHAASVARYAWADRDNGAFIGDPTSGKPRWSSALPANYFASGSAPDYVPGMPCRDRDVDGDGTVDVPSTFDTIAEVDQQFLRNLGEWGGSYATGTRPLAANRALRAMPQTEGGRREPFRTECIDLAALGSKTIKALRVEATFDGDQTNLMELIVNDMRMSFFGASPDYPDFRPLDFNDDGSVSCSCYATGKAPADSATGFGPIPEKWWSLTGCFVMAKSRYYRIFTRGQLFDEIRNVPVAESNFETVYVVDPNGDVRDSEERLGLGGNGLADSHVLFQRRLENRYRGTGSHVMK